jgi:hypothetical protein
MSHRILLTAVLTASIPVLLAAAPVVHSGEAPRWRPVRTETPLRPVAGTYGTALAASDGRLWIGPARDTDVGDGPPQVTAVGGLGGGGGTGSVRGGWDAGPTILVRPALPLPGGMGSGSPRSFGPFRPALPSAASGGYTRAFERCFSVCLVLVQTGSR